MTDRIPGAPGRYSANLPQSELEKMQAGSTFAITLTRDDDPIVEGTPYSKGAVLPDELAAKLCPNVEDPAPKDAFAALHLITAQGRSGDWAYRKWENGVAECWSVGMIRLNYKWSTLLSKTVQLPFPITSPNVTMVLPSGTAYDELLGPMVLTYGETNYDDYLYLFLSNKNGGFTDATYAPIHIKIVGYWK